jgi:threonine aldolase
MKDGLYFTIAKKAVDQAMRIRAALMEKGIPLLIDSPTNQLFPVLTDDQLDAICAEFDVALWERWDESHAAVRVCTSWATPDEIVDRFIAAVKGL